MAATRAIQRPRFESTSTLGLVSGLPGWPTARHEPPVRRDPSVNPSSCAAASPKIALLAARPVACNHAGPAPNTATASPSTTTAHSTKNGPFRMILNGAFVDWSHCQARAFLVSLPPPQHRTSFSTESRSRRVVLRRSASSSVVVASRRSIASNPRPR